jgi:hypothetical protein
MKKMISNFADSLLTREDLKGVKGGVDGGNCCAGALKTSCNGTCGEGGGTCEWMEAKPALGLEAGCVCDHS